MTATDQARLAGAADERYWRTTVFAVFVVTVARLAWLGLGKADLYADEAQYWIWSLHPAFGYYSKPPLVAWLIAVTTGIFGDDELAVRLSAPLLHFATALGVFWVARLLYDGRVAQWSAVVYATLPGVTASAMIMSTDAPLLLCWTAALYAFIRARREDEWRWWLAVGAASGVGLLAKYAMAYWLISALLYLLAFRDERRHAPRYLGAVLVALLIYAPNFAWNALHGFVSYHHTADNASLGGPLFHPESLAAFVASQFAVFGPLLFAALIAIVAQGSRVLGEPRAALLAMFALPTLAMMVTVSLLSRAQPNWSAPTYVSATILVVAWALERGRLWIASASVTLHVALAVVVLEAHDAAATFGYDLPAKYDILHRLRGWKVLGAAVTRQLAEHPGTILLAENREDMASLVYYVRPHPFNALKWNGTDNLPHDQFDLEARPDSYIGDNFLLVSPTEDIAHITVRFASAGPVQHIIIPLGGGETRAFVVRLLYGFKGYG